MLSLTPKLHELVGTAASRNFAQLRELGVEPTDRCVRVAVVVPRSVTPARRILATTLIDMLLRLDPLVGEVLVFAPGLDEDRFASEVQTKIPVAVRQRRKADADFTIGVAVEGSAACDLSVDGAGWVAAIAETAGVYDDGNSVGSLTGAALAAAEVFKHAFGTLYPERAARLEMRPWTGAFSFFSYRYDRSSPALPDLRISTTLVGTGGVGAGFVAAIGALGDRVTGALDLVDRDVLTRDNLNRVSFATLEGALTGKPKVVEAEALLQRCCPALEVTGHPVTFDVFKQRIPRRADRRYDVVVTGLDDDEARWEVQRDLPRILIDGATGNDMVSRVERVEFGAYGCLGCSRQPTRRRADAPEACDAPPDEYAPSLSFVSSFPGILAAGEVIKEAMGTGGLRGQFDHIFRYGPNPDLIGMPAIRNDCRVGCSRPSKLRQYREKYPIGDRRR
jgi:molybdopterin/thiamine biosynthesis adenylyltransferase